MTSSCKNSKTKIKLYLHLNEDGVYSDLKSKKLIYELKGERPVNFRKYDGCYRRND